MDVTYSLREEEDTEEETNVTPNSGTIRKLNKIKKIHHQLNWTFFMVNLNQTDNNNSNENFIQFTANFKMADAEVSGECSSHISVKNKVIMMLVSVKVAENKKFN